MAVRSQDVVPVDDLVARFGSAQHPDRGPGHERPDGVSDETVAALGALTAALETAEHARGNLYAFHRLTGRSDNDLKDAVEQLRAAGHVREADVIERVLVGRDVLPGMWTFQVLEAYDRHYLEVFRAVERSVRTALGVDVPHLAEAELKVREQGGSAV